MSNEKDYIDVDFTESEQPKSKDRIINGEPLFFTTSQVAKMLNFPVSTIRLYTKRFNDLLDIELSNSNNQYKKTDIEKLKFILKLTKEEGLTLQQAKDYCSSKGFDLNNIEKAVMDSNNPLALQTFITASNMEMDKKLDAFAEKLFNKIAEDQQKNNESLHETIANTIEYIVTEKLDLANIGQFESQEKLKDYIAITVEEALKIQSDNIKTQLDSQISQSKEHDIEIMNLLKQHMEERKFLQIQQEQSQQQKKGFFGKLFGK